VNPYDQNFTISTTTNKWLVPELVDTVLRGNEFFGEVLADTKDFYSPYMEFPKLIVSPYFVEVSVKA
jgi:hypothetical protein